MKFTIRNKLIASFGLIILLTSFLGVYSIISIKNVKDKASEIAEVWYKRSELAHTMDQNMSEYRLREYRHVLEDDPDLMNATEKELQDLREEFEDELKEYQGTMISSDDMEIFKEIKEYYPKYFETSRKTIELSRESQNKDAFNLMYGESRQDFENVNSAIEKLVQYNQEQANLANIQNDQIYNHSRLMLTLNVIIIIIISLVVTISIINIITKRINFLVKFINKTSDLDLVFDQAGLNVIKRYKDEFYDMGMALANMRRTLRELVENIKQNSVNVALNSDILSNIIFETSQSIEAIAKAIDEMVQGSTDLARNTETGVDKLEVLAKEIHDSVENTNSVKNYIELASKSNLEGMENINKLKSVVESNHKVAENILDQVSVLNNKSQSIEKITDAIKGITSQINILSLNATIEAARAGVQGNGFSIVAEEIRKLAYEAADSTKEIDAIVREVKKEINKTKSEMKTVGDMVIQMGQVSNDTEKAFKTIENSASNIVKQIDRIVFSISSIDNNKNDVIGSISDMSAIAEESASTTEEISASIEQQSASMEQINQSAKNLKNVSIELQDLIAKFRT
ncbi:methyl-accepting chemotaxis protein [Clostridium beijerinckii]|uniref:methyl-accepting chemotaxis protein n=1 Tax=Clostridium beijerinckii TaxID=1520 RepID=UPI00098C4E2E|nr:methyl-accepting chemotaxis protein [Clostridium beijerinckii]OOM41871.1 methyl-accepting chemotaxis protein McpA [Clostridium beijerinckii]